ncbi:MAG: AMP-binding protein [Bradymonadia bacterium]
MTDATHLNGSGAPGGAIERREESPLSVRGSLAGKHIFITGTTGFVGKVLLAMIIAEIPEVRRISVLVRPNRQYDSVQERFDGVVALSEPFQAIAERMGNEALERWLEERINVVGGDVTYDNLGMSDEDYAEVTERDPVDLIIHCAGKVNFNPPLDQALGVNALGVAHKLEFAKKAGCPLVHMSTCFVAGSRSDNVLEDPNIVGYSPSGRAFDAEREMKDAVALCEEIRKRALTQTMERQFEADAKDALTAKGLDYEDPQRLAEATKTCRNRWIDQRLTEEGEARAESWGWTNIYTYTKSLGEQVTIARSEEMGVPVTIVRPAIVESSLSFPFPGWNEGINTSAPILYLLWKGHRFVPADPDNTLDVVPVDYVCRGTLVAAAEIMNDRHKRVYQFATGDFNPLTMRRAVELANLSNRQGYDDEQKNIAARYALKVFDSVVVPTETFDRVGAPAIHKWAKRARGLLKQLPAKGPVARPIIKQLDKSLKGAEQAGKLSAGIMKLFKPFIEDNNPCFSTFNVRQASKYLPDDEKAVFAYDLDDKEVFTWRHYWMDVHIAGLKKWVFGLLDDKVKQVRKVARARDLIEVYRTATRTFAERKALSYYTAEGEADAYTYEEMWEASLRVAAWLKNVKKLGRGDAVVLMAKNEPAWPMIYFGILLADTVAVPLDPEMPVADARRICAKSEASLIITHEELTENFGVPHAHVGDCFDAEPLEAIEERDRSEDLASLLFTSGTTGDPKGVMLTHGNFTALLASLHTTFNINEKDRFLSVLPLFHTFEFSCGLLLPVSKGSSITYLEEIDSTLLRSALKDTRPTALIGVPALWDLLHRRIESQVEDRGEAARLTFDAMVRLTRFTRSRLGVNLGPFLFQEVHRTMGGRVRHLISGGAALSEPVLRAFEGLGFELLEGYGLTEAAPVLTVRRPGDRRGAGSVGRPLTGVEVQVINPDEDGVGEVIARGDNVMMGYLNDTSATEQTVRKGWLHTGDLGKLDKDGRLILVGRRKELIVTSSGKNVYPDELEPLFEDHALIEELAIVGIPDRQGDERVACMVVLVDDAEDQSDDPQGEVKRHFQQVNAPLADHQRIRTMRFWPEPLPRTATRKVKRKLVQEQLTRLVEMSESSPREDNAVPGGREPEWLYGALAIVTGMEAVDIEPTSHMISDLGLSSLQLVELRILLEERGGIPVNGADLANCETVVDLAELVQGGTPRAVAEAREADDADRIEVPGMVSRFGKQLLGRAQEALYDTAFNVRIEGEENIPYNRQVIVIANHNSHLDMGLVKYALADYAPKLSALAASDYFFDNKAKRTYFGQMTNLIPVERGGSLEVSLSAAEEAIAEGRVVLVFPEGTRSKSGQLQQFKHGIGYLALQSGLPVLPLYLRGTHRALPKGSAVPVSRRLKAVIGPIIEPEVFAEALEKENHSEGYAVVAAKLQQAIEALRDGTHYPWDAPAKPKAKGNGLVGVFDELETRFVPGALGKRTTWYFSLGTGGDARWTVQADDAAVVIKPGRPEGGQADCVLKTDPRTFERIVREHYVPGFAEFAEGKVKTNDPDLLRTFQTTFNL